MKWWRYAHNVLFALSFLPLVLSLWPFHLALLPPLLLVIPFAVNEFVLDRKSKPISTTAVEDRILHEYREPFGSR